MEVLKKHSNLNLDEYSPYVHEFTQFSQHIFTAQTVFSKVIDNSDSFRTTQKEYKATTKRLLKAGKDASPSRVNEIIKKLPPFQNENISREDISTFQNKAGQGWLHMTKCILSPTKKMEKRFENLKHSNNFDFKEQVYSKSKLKTPNTKVSSNDFKKSTTLYSSFKTESSVKLPRKLT